MAKETLAEAQRRIVLETLREFDGHQTRTAEALGIPIRTLQRWLADWKISANRQDGVTKTIADSV